MRNDKSVGRYFVLPIRSEGRKGAVTGDETRAAWYFYRFGGREPDMGGGNALSVYRPDGRGNIYVFRGQESCILLRTRGKSGGNYAVGAAGLQLLPDKKNT